MLMISQYLITRFYNCIENQQSLPERMPVPRYLLILLFVGLCYGQVTLKKNPLLSRKRRYLLFPEGSNFVMTMSFVKSVMIKIGTPVNVLGECDVPFKLPSDPRTFRANKNHRRTHYRQRREIYTQMEEALNQYGLDGNACVKRIICDAENYLPPKGKSLVGDLLSTVFTFSTEESEGDYRFHNYCANSTYYDCQVPFLHLIMESLLSN